MLKYILHWNRFSHIIYYYYYHIELLQQLNDLEETIDDEDIGNDEKQCQLFFLLFINDIVCNINKQ